jgi:DNA-binding XRE family transcriptional regulator
MTPNAKLRKARLRAGLSQAQLAERLGVHQQHVSRWEVAGVIPNVPTAIAIARVLKTTVPALWGEDKP